jgi:hypothetical protein
MTEHHVPLVSLTYETAALALSLMAKVIEGAVVANATTGRVSSASGDDAPSPGEAHKAALRLCGLVGCRIFGGRPPAFSDA